MKRLKVIFNTEDPEVTEKRMAEECKE